MHIYSRQRMDGHFAIYMAWANQLFNILYRMHCCIHSSDDWSVYVYVFANSWIINNAEKQWNVILSVDQRKLIVYTYTHKHTFLFAFKNDSVLAHLFSLSLFRLSQPHDLLPFYDKITAIGTSILLHLWLDCKCHVRPCLFVYIYHM